MRYKKNYLAFILISFILILTNTLRPSDEFNYKFGLHYSGQIYARSGFRNLYGQLNYLGGNFSIVESGKSELEFSISWTRKISRISDDLSIESIPLAITYKHKLYRSDPFSFHFLLGPALYFAKVKYETIISKKVQSDRGAGANAGLGLNAHWHRLILTFEFIYRHTFLGDPDKGRFGNIGGINYLFGIGIGI